MLARLGPLPVPRAANIVFQACLGLAVAHKAGIVHRDIKPENLLITDAGDGTDLVKILDFGIAKLRSPDASVATASGMMMGTYFYMSPEQVRDAAKVNPRTDVWALGVVLYELLTGKKPFDGAEPTEILYQIVHESPLPPDTLRSGLPPELVMVIDRALHKDIERRFASVSAFAQALAPFTGRLSVRPNEPSAISALATQAAPITAAVQGHLTTSHAAASAISKVFASPFKASRSRRAILIVGTLLAFIMGAVGLAAVRAGRRARPIAASSFVADTSSGGLVHAAPLSSSAAPLVQPSAPLPGASVSSTSNNSVRTLSEQAGHGSGKAPLNGPGRSTSRPTAAQTLEKSIKTGVASVQPKAKPAPPTNKPLTIDPEIPF